MFIIILDSHKVLTLISSLTLLLALKLTMTGVGGIPTGSNNEEITLTSCEIVGSAEEMPEPMPVVWGTQVNIFYILEGRGGGSIREIPLPLSVVGN